MGKADAARPINRIIAGLGVIIVIIAPGTHRGGAVAHMGVRIGIKQPEGDIHSLDLVDVVLILKHLRQQPLAGEVLEQTRLGGGFIQLEGDHQIGLQRAG